jgi:hypothetical protein
MQAGRPEAFAVPRKGRALPLPAAVAYRRYRLAVAAVALVAVALLPQASSALSQAAPVGTGKTVAFALSRSGSAGVTGGACGTRLQCFKTAITEANANTTSIVENEALVLINVDAPDQDVNMKLSGKQLLIAPDADPNLNGTRDYAEAVNKVSLGGGTCYTCALQAAQRSFAGARPDSRKVIVLVSERTNTFASTGFTSGGVPTGYPAMTIWQMAGQFDENTVVRAFAVGPSVTCSADPNGYGSLNDAASATPGGTCTEVASFDGLGAVLTEAVTTGAQPPDTTPPAVTLTAPAAGASIPETAPTFSGAAGTAYGDETAVTVKVWQGSDTSGAPLETLAATASAGSYSVQASPPLAAGAYTAQAEQRDAAGNVGRSALVGFTVAPPPPAGPEPYASAVRADAPRAYWRLGETTGTVAKEDQERANGTYVGGVALGVAGSNHDGNPAAGFDGGNDKVGVPDPSDGSLDFGVEDFTVEAWIKPGASDERGIVAKRSANAAEPYWALTVTDDPNHNGQVRAVYFDGTNTRTAYSSKGVVDGAWHHVVAWFDRDSGITISVDGVTKLTALAIGPDVSNTGELQIGKAPNNPYFKGDIDEVALYAGLLPTERIQAHAAAATG